MIGILLNLVGFFLSLFTTVITFSFCLFILLQRRHRQDLELFLCATTFLAVSVFSLLLFFCTVRALKIDFSIEYDEDSIMCRLQAYMICVAGSAGLSGYCLQATSRLIRVVYPQRLWLRTFNVYLLAVIASWICACLLMCPYLIIENFFGYLRSENYCLIDFTNLSAMIYIIVPGTGAQLGFISAVYFRLAIFVHHSVLPNVNREFAVVKRIFFTILMMNGMFIPTNVFWSIYLSTGYLNPMTYRVQLLSYSMGTLMMNGTMIFINPRLRSLVFVRQRPVGPVRQVAIAQIPIS